MSESIDGTPSRRNREEFGNDVQVADGRLAEDHKAEESPQSTYLKMSHRQSKLVFKSMNSMSSTGMGTR